MSENFAMTPIAICEDCWLAEHVRWEPESIDETGSILMRLSGVDVPEKFSAAVVAGAAAPVANVSSGPVDVIPEECCE